jgi:uncharacterized protein
MRIPLVLFALAAGFLCAPSALRAQAPAEPADPVVIVRGEGVVKAAPDMAWVTIGAEHRARDAKQAQADNAAAMNAVHARLLGLGIPKEALRTLSYDLQLEFDYKDGRQVPRGYVARSALEVRLDEVARVGEVLEAAVVTGATAVRGVRFDLKARAQLERDALTRAVADARARAEAAATGAGPAIGRIVRIEEGGAGIMPPPQPYLMAPRMAAEDSSSQPAMATGEIEVRAQVTLTATLR